jgi:hypothetical protein
VSALVFNYVVVAAWSVVFTTFYVIFVSFLRHCYSSSLPLIYKSFVRSLGKLNIGGLKKYELDCLKWVISKGQNKIELDSFTFELFEIKVCLSKVDCLFRLNLFCCLTTLYEHLRI